MVEMMPEDFVEEALDLFGPEPLVAVDELPPPFVPGVLNFGMLPPELQKGGRWQYSNTGVKQASGGGANGNDDIELFILKHKFEPNVVQKFRELDPDLQRQIIARGSMTSARDPNAVLMSRIALARHGKLNPPVPRPAAMMMAAAQAAATGGMMQGVQPPMAGDWYCPGCGDLQFARNLECRRCGTANPSPDPFVLQKLRDQASGAI
mmetsp:Transcript_67618/g.218630  ORF Transcript_67618/g.218630 Transcript_67618/m.218630 type:complete len:207 (-) Transcript_67618:236-856(-)